MVTTMEETAILQKEMLNLIEKNTQIKKDVLIQNFLVSKNHNQSGEKQGVYNASKVSDRTKNKDGELIKTEVYPLAK